MSRIHFLPGITAASTALGYGIGCVLSDSTTGHLLGALGGVAGGLLISSPPSGLSNPGVLEKVHGRTDRFAMLEEMLACGMKINPKNGIHVGYYQQQIVQKRLY